MSDLADSSHKDPTANRRFSGSWVLAWVVVIVSIPNLWVALFVIPRFAAIYRDMLPNKPLGSLTAAVLQSRWGLAALACLWPLAALLVSRRYAAAKVSGALLGLTVAQICFTTVALFLPLIVLIQAQGGTH